MRKSILRRFGLLRVESLEGRNLPSVSPILAIEEPDYALVDESAVSKPEGEILDETSYDYTGDELAWCSFEVVDEGVLAEPGEEYYTKDFVDENYVTTWDGTADFENFDDYTGEEIAWCWFEPGDEFATTAVEDGEPIDYGDWEAQIFWCMPPLDGETTEGEGREEYLDSTGSDDEWYWCGTTWDFSIDSFFPMTNGTEDNDAWKDEADLDSTLFEIDADYASLAYVCGVAPEAIPETTDSSPIDESAPVESDLGYLALALPTEETTPVVPESDQPTSEADFTTPQDTSVPAPQQQNQSTTPTTHNSDAESTDSSLAQLPVEVETTL